MNLTWTRRRWEHLHAAARHQQPASSDVQHAQHDGDHTLHSQNARQAVRPAAPEPGGCLNPCTPDAALTSASQQLCKASSCSVRCEQ